MPSIIWICALFQNAGWVPGLYGPGVNVPEYAGPGSHDSTFSNGHTRPDEHICRSPNSFADHDRCRHQRHARVTIVVGGSAQEAVLTHSCPRPNDHPPHTVAIHVRAKAAERAHLQVPRRPDPDRRMRIGIGCYLCAEQAQQTSSPAMECLGTRTIREQPDGLPENPHQLICARMRARIT